LHLCIEQLSDTHIVRYRQEQAPDLFLGAFIPRKEGKRQIVGYICSTLSPSETLTHESMSVHVPSSSTVCIHAICVEKQSQRKGIATRMLKEYISRLRARAESGSVPYERVVLISHGNLIQFYENAGFINLGRSEVAHGSLPWYELRVELKNNAGQAPGYTSGTGVDNAALQVSPTDTPLQQLDHQMQSRLWEALLHNSSSGNKPTGKQLSSSESSMTSLTTVAAEGILVNKFDLLCPRLGCGSVILKGGVGKWTERASEQVGSQCDFSKWRIALICAISFSPWTLLFILTLHHFLLPDKQPSGG
jgi:GNAT superfamily N-acetyltransferase